MLATILSHSYLLPKYKETELRVSSVKAIISIKENEVHELWSQYDSLVGRLNINREDYYVIERLHEGLERYLRCAKIIRSRGLPNLRFCKSDKDISFLVARLLKNYAESRSDFVAPAWEFYLKVAAESPLIIEWDTLSTIFTHPTKEMERFVRDSPDLVMQ